MFRTCGVCSNYRWLVPLRVARSLKPIVCRRLLARFGATGRGRSGFPCEPRAVPARPVSSDKLVAMAGFDDEDAWDMECSIDLKISASLRTRPRKFEEFQSAIVELPLIFGMDEVAAVFRASPWRFPRVQ